ncbi:MAG: SDR family NAD(P)-dependent oxidoreductase [Maricaulaceae bacterium]
MNDPDGAGKVALVTGASRGLGRSVALELAQNGFHIIALARTQGALEALDDDVRARGAAATLIPFDLRQPEGLLGLAGVILERWGRLDALVGAAGVLGRLSPAAQIDAKIWGDVFAVNLTANQTLIRALDPLLRAAPAGRAVFLTSGAVRTQRAYWSAYAASKAGLEALVGCWAKELASTAVRVNLFNPGPVRTALRAQAMPGEDASGLPAPGAVAPHIAALAEPSEDRQGALIDYRDLAGA